MKIARWYLVRYPNGVETVEKMTEGTAATKGRAVGVPLEPVVVMTEEEWSNAIAHTQETAYEHGFNAGKGLKG